MLRRAPTAIQMTSEDITGYESRTRDRAAKMAEIKAAIALAREIAKKKPLINGKPKTEAELLREAQKAYAEKTAKKEQNVDPNLRELDMATGAGMNMQERERQRRIVGGTVKREQRIGLGR